MMPGKSKKRSQKTKGHYGTKQRPVLDVPEAVLKALENLWPKRIVEMSYDLIEDSYFHDIYPKLHAALAAIKRASIRYEREARQQLPMEDHSDSGALDRADHPPVGDRAYSYHLFFITPDDQRFRYDAEDKEPDEEEPGEEVLISGQGFIGCVVGVSLLAPIAVLGLNTYEEFESGGYSLPELEICAFCEDGKRVEPEQYLEEWVGDQAMEILRALRGQITITLKSHGIAVLSEQDQKKTVPWLHSGEEILRAQGPVTVKDALFFESL